jgi:hypothetical protein
LPVALGQTLKIHIFQDVQKAYFLDVEKYIFSGH